MYLLANVNRNAKPVTELKTAISTLYREVIAKPGHGASNRTDVNIVKLNIFRD
jgi:hypothetical protein